MSRSRIFELKPLGTDDIKDLLKRAVTDKEKGFGDCHVVIDDDAVEFMAEIAGGDARAALNALEIGILTTDKCEDGTIHWKFQRSASRNVLPIMIKAETIIIIQFQHLLKVCVVQIRMLQSIILQKCYRPEKTSSSLQGEL